MAYEPTVWVDDDGTNQVGTEFTAERMNKIEEGIAEAMVSGGGGGGAGVALRSAIGSTPVSAVNVLAATWTILPFSLGTVISSSDGSPDFTRTAAGALVFNKAGTYEITATLGSSTDVHPAPAAMLDTRLVLAAPGKATPDVSDKAIALERDQSMAGAHNFRSLAATVTVVAGSTLAALVFQNTGQVANGMGVSAFGVTLSGGVKGDKGDTGGNATIPVDPWHIVGAVGEPAFTNGWTAYNAGVPVRFRKLANGTVELGGLLKGGTLGQSAFTLPVGYRTHPSYGNVEFANEGSGAFAAVYVNPSGTVVPFIGSLTYQSLDGISFDTGTVTTVPVGPKGDKGDTGGNAMIPLDPWHIVGAAGEPALIAPFTTYQSVGFRKNPLGRVNLRGLVVTAGSAFAFGYVLFTLPVGFRPPAPQRILVEVTEPNAAKSVCQLQVTANGQVSIAAYVTGTVTSGNPGTYITLDEVEFDTETVTEMPSGPQGPQGIQGVPGNSITVPIDPWHTVGAVGEPAYQGAWAGSQLKFKKDPLGRVWIVGPTVTSGVTGTVAFTLPVGYRPAVGRYYDSLGGGGNTFAWIFVNTDGTVTISFTGVGPWIDLSFDTETVTQMPVGPKGDKGDPGTGVFKTLDWNTALAPGFYYGGSFGLEGNTLNSPGDPLNIEDQAGIVSINGDVVVQRVWAITSQRAFTRYKTGGGWTLWAVDVVKPPVYTEPMAGGFAPLDGDERFFQNAAMKAAGIMWRFRYNKTSASAYKWEFVGGRPLRNRVAAVETRASGVAGDLATVGPSITVPLSGEYDFAWGARIQSHSGTAAEGFAYMEVGGGYPFGAVNASYISSGLWGGADGVAEGTTTVNEGTLCRMKYATQSDLMFGFGYRWMHIVPVRVAL